MWEPTEKKQEQLNIALDILETRNRTKRSVLIVLGFLTTILLWAMHLSLLTPHSVLEGLFSTQGKMAFFFLPPFVTAYCLGKHLTDKSKRVSESTEGVMKSYAQMNQSNRDWKIMLLAAVIGVLNAFFMMFTTPIR